MTCVTFCARRALNRKFRTAMLFLPGFYNPHPVSNLTLEVDFVSSSERLLMTTHFHRRSDKEGGSVLRHYDVGNEHETPS